MFSFDTIPHDKLMECLKMRIADRSVLGLIRQWLRSPVVEPGKGGGGVPRRPKSGTPQGGVISPLLANLYLHWFDRRVTREIDRLDYRARLIRYADDLVVLSQKPIDALVRFMEEQLEGRFGLTINREKTRTVHLREKGAGLEFLGYRFQYSPDRNYGTRNRFLDMFPSKKSESRARERLHDLTGSRWNCLPIAEVIARVSRFLRGWGDYFELGYPRRAFDRLNGYVLRRMSQHLRGRSQRRCRQFDGDSLYRGLQKAGLLRLRRSPAHA